MTCKACKFFVFNQNDMMGACKLNPIVVNKLPQDWCGQQIPAYYEEKTDVGKPIEIKFVEAQYDINTDEVKPKRGRKSANKGTNK
jgi:hypothetical protein